MLKQGMKLRVKSPFKTYAQKEYHEGMILELYEPTGLAPYGAKSKLCNWYVICPYFKPPEAQSIWSGIWMLVENGWLEIIETQSKGK